MSFRIKTVNVYSYDGDCRTVKFNQFGLNIITGRAKTGKSSIIDIIDYCFGRSECYIAQGVIRRHVSWYAVEIENNSDTLFIARRNPDADKPTSPDIFIRRGNFDALPIYPELQKNITEDALIRLLTRFAGIAENEHRPLTGTRGPLQATIRHALFLCFQKQDEIASRDRLFHRQGDQFIPQAIKDTLPYFLGAVDEEHFLHQNELDDAVQQLRKLEAEYDAAKRSTNDALQRVQRFILDAKRVGLIDQTFDTQSSELAIAELEKATKTDIVSPTIVSDAADTIVKLQNELETLRQQFGNIHTEIRATRHFLSEQSSFSKEASEQRARLSTIGLYKADSANDSHCPVCESKLDVPTPSSKALQASLLKIEGQLNAVAAESPHLQGRIDELNKSNEGTREAIILTQRLLEKAYTDDARARAQRDQVIERARVMGRISAFLDQTSASEGNKDLAGMIEVARKKVGAIASKVNADDIGQRIDTYLNLISNYMTEYSKELDLEHTDGRIRLDLKKLTVVADTFTGPIPLNRIGSGENWVGYHVATHLALHRWFRDQFRPVPGFIILDQPTQAHYPPEADHDGRIDTLQDEDRRAVHNLFELMKDAAAEVGEDFQLIVLDHAHLDDSWFEESIVEVWRGDDALIPEDWIVKPI